VRVTTHNALRSPSRRRRDASLTRGKLGFSERGAYWQKYQVRSRKIYSGDRPALVRADCRRSARIGWPSWSPKGRRYSSRQLNLERGNRLRTRVLAPTGFEAVFGHSRVFASGSTRFSLVRPQKPDATKTGRAKFRETFLCQLQIRARNYLPVNRPLEHSFKIVI
jgi:hypothetical protein